MRQPAGVERAGPIAVPAGPIAARAGPRGTVDRRGGVAHRGGGVSKFPDDLPLIRKCLAGDDRAFAGLVQQYHGVLYRLAWRMLRSEEEARDVTQEAFLRVYRALHTFDQSRKFSTWILRITTNLCIDRLRRRKMKTLSIDVDGGDEDRMPLILVDQGPTPEMRYGRTSVRETLDQLIKELPPIYRAVIELRHKQELAYEEIADVLEIPLGTVKARLHRAHRLLKDRLQAVGIGPDQLQS